MNPLINKKIIILCATIILVILCALTIYSLIPRSYLVFETAPQQVVVSIDSRNKQLITNGDKVSVEPGKHSIIVFRDEFNPYSTSVETKNGQTVYITAALIGLTDSARKLLDNEVSSKVSEHMTALTSQDEIILLEKLNPIINLFPIETRNYHINSCPSQLHPDSMFAIALCVDITDNEQMDNVKQNIKNLGYDPNSFEYIWNNIWGD